MQAIHQGHHGLGIEINLEPAACTNNCGLRFGDCKTQIEDCGMQNADFRMGAGGGLIDS